MIAQSQAVMQHGFGIHTKTGQTNTNKNDQQWYDTTDADWIFERTEGADSIAEYNGTVKIKNIGVSQTLENWKSTNTWWVGLGVYGANPSEDMWNVRSDHSNKNYLQLDIQNWFLAQQATSNYRSYLLLKYDEPAGFPYSFVPAVKLEAKMTNFEFTRPMDEELLKHTSQKGLIDAYEITNDNPGAISRKVTVSEKVTNVFSWGFSESLKAFAKVSGKAGIPFVAEGEVETGFEIEFAANQNWETSVEKTFEMSYDVSILPNTRVKISAYYDLINGISMDYTATSEITGTTSRISVFDDIVQDTPATGEMMRNHLNYSNFDGEILEVKKNSVIARVKGTMVASVGVRGRLNVNGEIVRTKT